jgi:hypothetical protein
MQASSIAALSSDYALVSKQQDELLRHRSDLAKLEKLKNALELGLIDQTTFNEKARALLMSDI